MSSIKLEHRIISVSELGEAMRERMVDILQTYYGHTSREGFERDLAAKHAAICLFDPKQGALVGFSTLAEFSHSVEGQEMVILFSGDTIIEKAYWGSQELVKGFGEYIVSLMRRHAGLPVYWFLISKGIRTYRYLPDFFREYYPHPFKPTPEPYQKIMDSLAYRFFPDLYDPVAGVIRVIQGQYLKPEYFPATVSRNAIEAFYYRKNPGHVKGDELVCLTALQPANIVDFMRIRLGLAEGGAGA